MTYAPHLNWEEEFTRDIPGDDALYKSILANNDEVYEGYTPPILSQPVKITSTSTTHQERLVWRIRGNTFLSPVRLRVYAEATAGSGAVRLIVGTQSNDVSITTAGWYTVDVTPVAANTDCELTARVTSGGNSMTITAVQVYLVPGSPAVGSRLAIDADFWATTNKPVPRSVLDDARRNPRRITIDRPFVLATHCSDLLTAISGKTPSGWGIDDTAEWVRVGRLRMPSMVRRPWLDGVRVCRVDAYVYTSDSAEVEIALGSQSWSFTASSTGWYSTTLELSADTRQVTGLLIPGASEEAAIRTLQVWRGGA